MKLFDVDGPLYKFMTTLWDIMKLNFLWLIFSLPLFTIGASTVAAFAVTNKMAEEREGYVGRQFLEAFKANWKQGIPMGLMVAIGAYAVYLDFELQRVTESMMLQVAGILTCVILISAFLYAFALCARYENTIKNTLINSIQITVRYFPRTIGLLLVLAVELFVFLFNQTTLFFMVLIGPACIMYTISSFAMYIFRRIEDENGTKEAEEE